MRSSGTLTDVVLRAIDPDPDRAARSLSRRLCKFFRWRKCGSASEDLAQETLRRAFTQIERGTEVYARDPASYFLAIAENVAHEHWRSPANRPAVAIDDLADWSLIESTTPEAAIYREECLRYLAHCLPLLTPYDRMILVRCQTEKPAELAEAIGVPHGTLRVHVHRAKKKLWRLMQDAMASPGVVKRGGWFEHGEE